MSHLNNIIALDTDTTFAFFKCSCGEEWGYNKGMDTEGEVQDEELFKKHDCANLTVFQKKMSIARHFIKKI